MWEDIPLMSVDVKKSKASVKRIKDMAISVRWEKSMNEKLRQDAETIAMAAINHVNPSRAVKGALEGLMFPGRIYLVAVGKAAWEMAKAAKECLKQEIYDGIVVTKYGHVKTEIEGITCLEAGHPVPDENSLLATEKVLEMTRGLKAEDTVIFLLSGGGSALFESPYVEAEELQKITEQLLHSGADIVEMNTIRKRLSRVKGGRFAKWCEPAQIKAIILSDILGDPLDMIASGPATADHSTCQEALRIAKKYDLQLSEAARKCLQEETPKKLTNVETQIIGSVRELCKAAQEKCIELGYEPHFLTDQLNCEAKEAGRFLAAIAKSHLDKKKIAFIAGGETVVHVSGTGLGGRNQEFVFAAAREIAGKSRIAMISVGSDGTDGPTDAAGGYVDGDSYGQLQTIGIDYDYVLNNNDAYHGLSAINGLIFTGPTGTNVNDVAIVLIDEE